MTCLTIKQINKLGPCKGDGARVRALLRKFDATEDRCYSAADARAAGCTLDDVIWVTSAAARSDKVIERKLRMWLADVAAHVLPTFERECPGDLRVRNCINASRDFANGRITEAELAAAGAAWAAARAAAGAAWDAWDAWAAARAAWDAWDAWDAEETWQFDRLIKWLSDKEPRPLPLKGGKA